jgi:hypothetical protein
VQQKWHLPLLMCASALLMLTWLTDTRMYYHDDEWLYMKIAEEMFDKAEYWIPLWLGEPAYYKPPMTYWMMMLFFPFGEDRLLLARLSIALSSIATIGFLFLLARSLYRSSEAGFLAGMLALTSLGFIAFGKIGMMEMPMALFMTAALYCFSQAWQKRSGAWAGWFLAVAGASALVKGPITVLILGITAFLLLIFNGRWRPFFTRPALAGACAGLFFVVLWPLALYFKGEFPRWFSFFIIGENFGKFADAIRYPIGPFLLYIPQWCLPWTFLLLAACCWLVAHSRALNFSLGLPLIWALATVGIHLLPDTKLAWYMFLVVPPAMLLLAGVATQAKNSRVWRVGQLSTMLLVLTIAALLAIPAFFLWRQPAGPWLIAASLLLIYTGWLLWRQKLPLATVSCLIALWSVIGAGIQLSPAHFPAQPTVANAAQVAEVAVMRKQVYLYSYAFKKKIRQIVSPDQVVAVLERRGMVIIGQQDWNKVLTQYPGLMQQTIAQIHYFQWQEEIPLPLIQSALVQGDLGLLHEPVYVVALRNH